MRDEEIVRDYLNGHSSDAELASIFDLKKCDVCGEYMTEDETVYHKWDIGEMEEQICENCRNDEQGYLD